MNTNVADVPAPTTTTVVVVEGISNAEFFERYAAPGRIGLCGGSDVINRSIRELQFALTADGARSPWSHAFLCSGRRVDDGHWVLESDLDLRHKQIRLGAQENRIDRYHDDAAFPNLAILDFGLDEACTRRRNLLEVEGALYCSALVQHCYASAGIEFAAGVDRKNVTPHDIGTCGSARTVWQVVREPAPPQRGMRARLRAMF